MLSGRPPPLTSQAVAALATTHFNFTTISESSVKSLHGYYDRNYYLQGRYQGGYQGGSHGQFVLKMFNPLSTPYRSVEGIIKVMKHLSSRGFVCPDPVVSRTGRELIELSTSELLGEVSGDQTERRYPVSILSYIPGEVFNQVEQEFLSAELMTEVGEWMGRLDKELMVSALVVIQIVMLAHEVCFLRGGSSLFPSHSDIP